MTEQEIIQKVKQHMQSIKLEYDEEIGIDIDYRENQEIREGGKKEVYVVSFKTPSYIERDKKGEIIELFEGYYCWCYVDAKTYEIMYYMKPHGYIEVDGTGHWI